MKYFASCSFGKDSIATILLALEHNEPLDGAVFAEVMFDHSRGISGEIPEHIEWVYSTAIPRLESMGCRVNVVKGKKDYVYFFSKYRKNGAYQGKIYGFPVAGMCMINVDCKLNPIKEFYKQFKGQDITQYVGIASDEERRLKRMKENQVSLLNKYGYTEEMAMAKCKEYDLVSPVYSMSCRGGCWFCPNGTYERFGAFRKSHPDLWGELLKLGRTPNLCTYGFKYGKTIEEVDAILDGMDSQLTLF